ncbi:hypothetical protein, partial [Streptomyces sp. NPDC096068]|uniref:hypothetical protein n=1 Tax=Streptomyces sp. NPDC096068 TaxID=3155424 RepID=UPI0033259D37
MDADGTGGGVLGQIAALRARVAALVEARSAGDPTAGDPLRGLYVTGETAQRPKHVQHIRTRPARTHRLRRRQITPTR